MTHVDAVNTPTTTLLLDTLRDATGWADLEFGGVRDALLVFVALLGVTLLILLVSFMRRGSLRGKIALPAVLPVMRHSPLSLVRHLPLLLFVAGVPFFAIARLIEPWRPNAGLGPGSCRPAAGEYYRAASPISAA